MFQSLALDQHRLSIPLFMLLLSAPVLAAADSRPSHDHSRGKEPATAEHDPHAQHHDMATATAGADDPHAHHRAAMHASGYQRSEHDYPLPGVTVMDMNGVRTPLAEVVSSDKPIFVNFIFTTCTTICPVMTGVFAKLQDALGDERDDVRMLSFSIDPDYDTPARLRAYAELFGAESQWDFYTGRLEDIIRVEKAFDVYRGNKMNHEPTTLLRAGPDAPWVRIDGLASADDLLREYRKLTTAKASGH